MLTLKYPLPVSVSENPALPDEERLTSGAFSLFDCPLQGEPFLYQHHARELGRLMTEIRRRLKTGSAMVCHPHRVGLRNCVSVTLSNMASQEINLLLLISGEVEFPRDYEMPRWTVQVTDGVDLLFLLLGLKEVMK